MSWESVRNLKKMESTLLLVQNISAKTKSPDDVNEWIEDVRQSFTDAVQAISEGKAE